MEVIAKHEALIERLISGLTSEIREAHEPPARQQRVAQYLALN